MARATNKMQVFQSKYARRVLAFLVALLFAETVLAKSSIPEASRLRFQWQVSRSKTGGSVAGATTESFQMDVDVKQSAPGLVSLQSPQESVVARLGDVPNLFAGRISSDPRNRESQGQRDSQAPREAGVAVVILSRFDLARLLGILPELPMDQSVWQGSELVELVVFSSPVRVTEPLFKVNHDDAAVTLRVSVRTIDHLAPKS